MLSALVTSADKALTVLPISLVAQLVFSGAWVPLNGPVFRQLRDLYTKNPADFMKLTALAERYLAVHENGNFRKPAHTPEPPPGEQFLLVKDFGTGVKWYRREVE